MAIPGFDQAMQRLSERAAELEDAKHKDADETRRLLYMAIVAPRCKRYNLAGTLINALRHHHGVDDEDLEDKVVMLVNGDDAVTEGLLPFKNWAREQIAALTANLESHE